MTDFREEQQFPAHYQQ